MAFNYEKDDTNIVTVTIDMPGRAQNVINEEFGQSLFETFEAIKGEGEITGIIITSGKKDFIAGGDIDMLYAETDAKKVFEDSERMKAAMRELETGGTPVVAAINGTASSSASPR
jgi:3-hydroxyacyl-CoA dehydrogenase/enoyl-CoA hydratase/3-hydroxybutyryl-CoA epimerase